MVDSGKRAWKITSGAALPKIGRISRTSTLLDIRQKSAELYCADITEWAKAALADAANLEPWQLAWLRTNFAC